MSLIKRFCNVTVVVLGIFWGGSVQSQSSRPKILSNKIDLSGSWKFQTDPADVGEKENWYKRALTGMIRLPGSMTSNNLGDPIAVNTPWTGEIVDSSWFKKPEFAIYRKPGSIKVPFWLQPQKYYKGVAWYQKQVMIPANWKEKPIGLFIERAHWTTTLYVDGRPEGMSNALGAPHDFSLPNGLNPGLHTITIRIDNRVHSINVGQNSHSISDHTQGNWNGMVGSIYLQAHPHSYIKNVLLYPDIERKQVTAKVIIEAGLTYDSAVNLKLQAQDETSQTLLAPVSKTVNLSSSNDTLTFSYPMGKNPRLWSEHQPSLYTMKVSLKIEGNSEQRTFTFGMRNFSEDGTQFTINGHPTFLRGTLDCAAFPLTGFPPTDLAAWMRILKTCRAFGLNHIRFHSWCPPEAAFEAGDKLGLYFQIECSSWANQGATIGDGAPLDKYIYEESNRIISAFGNHPSFCMMAYGNEPAGKRHKEYLTRFVKYWQSKDSRHLYTTGSGWPVVGESDFNSTPDPRIQRWGEGLKSIINAHRPSTDYNWSNIISKWKHPTVSHEIGQWCVYPDFKEIKEYKGVYKARNFEIFRDQLEKNGLKKYEEDFLQASGKLQTLCYKADIEAALRTKGFGGFQLLGLEDFPGQGTALVGVLNVFYKPKSYITAAHYTQFCNDVVPLARFPKMTYWNDERLEVPVEIAQFSGGALAHASANWKVTDSSGSVLFKGILGDNINIPEGNGIALGQISQQLGTIHKPEELLLTITVGKYENSWHFFVYPKLVKYQAKVRLVDHLSAETIQSLKNGETIILSLRKNTLKPAFGGDIEIGFSSIFWNTAWTQQQPPVTLGLLPETGHPALKYFPTQRQSDYQWWDAIAHSKPILLDSVARDITPIVRVIDDWVTARSLALLFEGRVGKGKLIVSAIDLFSDMYNRPEARQLLYSLQKYAATPDFAPKIEIEPHRLTMIINND